MMEQKKQEKMNENPEKIQVNFDKNLLQKDIPVNTLQGRL